MSKNPFGYVLFWLSLTEIERHLWLVRGRLRSKLRVERSETYSPTSHKTQQIRTISSIEIGSDLFFTIKLKNWCYFGARSRALALFLFVGFLLCFPFGKLSLSLLRFKVIHDIRQKTASYFHTDMVWYLWDVALSFKSVWENNIRAVGLLFSLKPSNRINFLFSALR